MMDLLFHIDPMKHDRWINASKLEGCEGCELQKHVNTR